MVTVAHVVVLPSVLTTSRVPFSVSVYLLLWVLLLLFQAQAHLPHVSFTIFVSQLLSQLLRRSFCTIFTSFLCISFHVMSSSSFWRSNIVCEHRFLSSVPPRPFFSAHCVLFLLTSPHVVLGPWFLPHAGHTSHTSLPILYKASHVQTLLMCIALSCLRCHCVSFLDLNKCRDAALSIPFAASIFPEVFPSDHSESRISQSFSQVMLELPVFSFDGFSV